MTLEEDLPPSPPDQWPNGPAARGKVYMMGTPFQNEDGSDHRIIIMSKQSWEDHGTTLESLRRVAESQDKRIRELLAENATAKMQAQDAINRLEAIRDIRRAEKRADIEKELIMPGSIDFLSTAKRK